MEISFIGLSILGTFEANDLCNSSDGIVAMTNYYIIIHMKSRKTRFQNNFGPRFVHGNVEGSFNSGHENHIEYLSKIILEHAL